MTNRYTLPFRAGAAPLSGEEWERLPPIDVGRRLWLRTENPPETQARAFYDEEALNVNFRVFEASPTVRHMADGSPVYEDSCVEFFLQPLPGQDPRYLNFELNAAGALLLQLGANGEERRPVEIDRSVFGIRSAVGLSDSAAGRVRWELAFRIPFAFLRRSFPDFRPAPGVLMRGNFYKCGDRTPNPHYLSWQPVDSERPDFHRSECFGELLFGEYETSAGR